MVPGPRARGPGPWGQGLGPGSLGPGPWGSGGLGPGPRYWNSEEGAYRMVELALSTNDGIGWHYWDTVAKCWWTVGPRGWYMGPGPRGPKGPGPGPYTPVRKGRTLSPSFPQLVGGWVCGWVSKRSKSKCISTFRDRASQQLATKTQSQTGQLFK